jgi:hypothetical protein
MADELIASEADWDAEDGGHSGEIAQPSAALKVTPTAEVAASHNVEYSLSAGLIPTGCEFDSRWGFPKR